MSLEEQFTMVDGSVALRKLAEETGYRTALCPRIYVTLEPDECPDLSHLEQGYADVSAQDQRSYQAQDRARLAAYGDTWTMLGIRAVAVVYIPQGPRAFQRLIIASSGCWSVESDSGSDYLRSLAEDQLTELRDTLAVLHVHEPATQTVEWDTEFQVAI